MLRRGRSRRGFIGRLTRWIIFLILLYPLTVLALTGLWLTVPPVSTLMLARYVSGERVLRINRPIEQIAPALVEAVVRSEDARFCSHGGVDWKALNDVIEAADEEGPARGASTIPMQVAKNLFLWPSRSFIRKGMEIPLALWLQWVWPKKRMLEVYLNIAEWGPDGTFGVEAAARRHFGKSADELSVRESALLAKALPNPYLRNPARPGAGYARLAQRLAGGLNGRSVLACVMSED